MNEGENPHSANSQPEHPPEHASIGKYETRAEKHHDIAQNNKDQSFRLVGKFVRNKIKVIVDWLDEHNGLVTAVATLAIAILTYLLASYASDQGSITTKQNAILSAQTQIAIAGQRPFVNVSDIEMTKFVRAGRSFWRFSPVVSNDGGTPTVELQAGMLFQSNGLEAGGRNVVMTMIFPMGEPPAVYYPPDPSISFDQRHFGFIIGPHGKQTVGTGEIPEDIMVSGIRRGWSPHFSGEFRYRDTLPNTPPRITKFCYELSGDFDTAGAFVPIRNFCPHWNCADDECKTDKEANDQDVAAMLAERAKRAAQPAVAPNIPPKTLCVGPRINC